MHLLVLHASCAARSPDCVQTRSLTPASYPAPAAMQLAKLHRVLCNQSLLPLLSSSQLLVSISEVDCEIVRLARHSMNLCLSTFKKKLHLPYQPGASLCYCIPRSKVQDPSSKVHDPRSTIRYGLDVDLAQLLSAQI
mmetsp:Transcript_4629/g.18449  ORF Transcript_4629/g.18449 Transcript_4629/m.18449 type:complete len:137 (-) Transcript_4629:1514-1924(-)|eukprot:scaffold1136_cov260-Pinguiococcus_pyrenoidosus.AAC.8